MSLTQDEAPRRRSESGQIKFDHNGYYMRRFPVRPYPLAGFLLYALLENEAAWELIDKERMANGR